MLEEEDDEQIENQFPKKVKISHVPLTANLSSLSVPLAISMLVKGVKEFLTEGIIHCWKSAITTLTPIATSRMRFNKNRLRILDVLGKFNS